MKNLFTLCAIFLVMYSTAFAQKIRFTDSDNQWNVFFAKLENGGILQQEYQYKAHDTITIGGLIYRRTDFGDIREDTLTGKVYVTNPYKDQDTLDRLLYDYKLNFGDTATLYYGSDSSKITLLANDSLQIDSVWYKVLHFGGYYYYGGFAQGQWVEYTIIEGIGCISGLLWPLRPFNGEGGEQLECFYSKNGKPILSKTVDQWFDNNKSCYLSINDLKKKLTAEIFPNPITVDTKIAFPDIISKGNLQVVNALGQVVFDQNFTNKNSIRIGDKISKAGIYFYHVTDFGNSSVYTGKIVCQ